MRDTADANLYREIGKQLSPFVSSTRFSLMSESTKLNVSDEVTTEFLRFVSTGYNDIDFSEIEKSNGDIKKFKYYEILNENLNLLEEIYKNHDSKIYNTYIIACRTIIKHLENKSREYGEAYLKEIGFIQINYVTMVTTVIYTLSTLISATIRFISIDNSSEIEVIVEDLAKHANYVFLKNSREYAAIIDKGEMDKVLNAFIKSQPQNEAFVMAGGLTVLAVPIIIFLTLKLIPIIREIIYMVYFLRVRITDALELQIMLLNTNIEALENGQNPKKKKIIAKQKNTVTALTKARDIFIVKIEKAEPQMRREIQHQDKEIEKKHPGSTEGKTPDIMI